MLRRHLLALPVLLSLPVLLGILSCAGDGEAAAGPEPLPPAVAALAGSEERLEAILALGREPGRLPVVAWEVAEEAVRSYLPPLEGDLTWRVIYTDLPGADYIAVDLMEGPGETAARRAWFHVLYLPEPLSGERFDGEPLAGFPTAGMPGRYLRLRAGKIDLLAVPDVEELASEEALRELVGRWDLEGLAGLEPERP